MLLGGKGGCQQCTCVPCDACTRTCQNPHTGGAFETVYTRYFESVEAGNPSDGYLSASGDSDTSDPYDGMDGTGPWYQQVSGTFTINSTQTRHPCMVRVSFWRNNYTLGAATIPPASSALTFQGVFVTVTSGAVRVGDRVIVPADGEVEITTISIPLVSGGGDQSANDPRFYDGTISVEPQCDSATFSIRARIEWNTKKRQHVLYGLVRECYEIGTPCSTYCSGSASPSAVYLTISNLSVTGEHAGQFAYPTVAFMDAMKSFLNGTFVLDRTANFCDSWIGAADGGECAGIFGPSVSLRAWKGGVSFAATFGRGNTCRYSAVFKGDIPPADQEQICSGYSYSGTGTTIYAAMSGDGADKTFVGSFDWTLEP